MNKKTANNILAFSLGAVVLVGLPLMGVHADQIESTISSITSYLVTISFGVALLMYVAAGFLYMAAAGDSNKVEMAKSIITFTTVGLIIILLAEAIVSIVKGFTK
jgi:heme/copper-type cytochrome/quinol oxidase subunit 2